MSLTEAQKYKSWVEIDLENFKHNGDEIRRLIGPDVKILQVVKADAYGHGAIEISKFALKNGASCLGVANADEGVQLRVSGIDAPIVILSPSAVSEINAIVKYNLIPSVSDIHFARELDERFGKEGKLASIHIEVDTGMGRGGTIHHEAVSIIKEIFSLRNIRMEGIFSHLSLSEEEDNDYNALQWEFFGEVLEKLGEQGIHIPIKHFSNSGGVLNFSQFNMDMIRPGIMTYGIYPSPLTMENADLLPVMSFKTSIVLLKEFPKGYNIGYGRSYVTRRPTTIATIPVGYGDGYGFILSNRGEALVRGKRVPIVGRISMDMCTVDVTDIPGCGIGDEVVLLGKQGDEYISANEIAEKANTISYEVLCALGKRAPRVFVNKGRTDTIEPRLRRIFIPDEDKSIARIDSIIRSCLQARTSNVEFGDAIYYEMFETLFGKENRQLELRTGFKYDITAIELEDEGLARDFFRVKTHIEYVKTLKNQIFIIGCALNNNQLSALFDDERCEYRWLLNGPGDLFHESTFQVDCVRVDNEDVPVIVTENTDRGYEVWCGGDQLEEKLNRQVKVEIEIITMKNKKSNTLSVYLVYPTRGLEVSFNYEGAGLKNVREISFFAGKQPYPEIEKESEKSIRLKISDDEWVFPTSGVTFIWDK
jgi:alanine racemase